MKLRTQPNPQIHTQCYAICMYSVHTCMNLRTWLSPQFHTQYMCMHIQKAYKIVWLGIWRLHWDLRLIIQRVVHESLYDRVPVSRLHPHIRTQLPSLHPPVTNLLMYWILPILQAAHIGAMWYKRLYAPLSVETCMNNSILQYYDICL